MNVRVRGAGAGKRGRADEMIRDEEKPYRKDVSI